MMGADDMFNIGDLIIYSGHGICQIDDICEKTYHDETKNYYVLHPVTDSRLSISTPVDNKSVIMLELLDNDEAEELLNSFKLPGAEWIEKDHQRNQTYTEIINNGNRLEISKIINTLMRRGNDAEKNNKKLYVQDRKLLAATQSILFHELAISTNTTFEAILDKVTEIVDTNELPVNI